MHHLSGRKVAVKVIDKAKLTDANEAKRIQREIRVMLHLTHECVIKLFEVGAPAHAPRMSMRPPRRCAVERFEGGAHVLPMLLLPCAVQYSCIMHAVACLCLMLPCCT